MTETEMRTKLGGIIKGELGDIAARARDFDYKAADAEDRFELLAFDFQILIGRMDDYVELFGDDSFYKDMDTRMCDIDNAMVLVTRNLYHIGAAAS